MGVFDEFHDPLPDRGLRIPALVSGPAWMLLITSSITLGLHAFNVVWMGMLTLLGMTHTGLPPLSTGKGFLPYLGFAIVIVLVNAVVAYGSFRMRQLRNYRLAWITAILALIPPVGPCFVLGIPAGIWAMVVLARPEVREAFDQGA